MHKLITELKKAPSIGHVVNDVLKKNESNAHQCDWWRIYQSLHPCRPFTLYLHPGGAVCEDYVQENFKDEYEKILAIRRINQCVTMCEDSPYQLKAIACEVNFDNSFDSKIIKSNYTVLMTNYIFYKFEKVENFKGKYVFLDASYLNNFKNLELAVQRRANCTFVIDCDHENFAAIETELNIQIEKIANFKKIIVLVGNHQNFGITIGPEYICNFDPSHINEEFLNHLKINFQGQEMSMTELITVEKFHTLSTLPLEKMHKECISIGNQMELKLISEYVERTFLIRNQSNKWDKCDDFGNILKMHRRILVANEPGAGKSIESIKIYYRLKDKYPNDWIVHINLSQVVEIFGEEKENFNLYSQSEKFKILFCHSVLKLNKFECNLFELLMKSDRAFLIFDSLDEISPFYFSLVRSLTEMIFLNFSEQRIIIFTRPHFVTEMEEFDFTIVKIDIIKENARNDLISKILNGKCARKSEKIRNDMKKSVQSFLQKRNFHTPLLIRMVTEVASMQKLISDEMTLYDVYKYFCGNFDRVQEDKNEDIKAEKMKLRDIDRYFQKCAVEKLIEYRVYSDIELFNHGRNEISKEDLITLKDDFFSSLQFPEIEKLQRKGITIHSKSNPKEFEFIHASFNDFYVADFIVSEIKSLAIIYKNCLVEIFSWLIQESRLNNVVEFLKGHNDVAKYLKEFDVISQMIDDSKEKNSINIMPVIKFIADSITCNPIIRKICKDNTFYPSMILFMDPMKTLEKMSSLKVPKSFVYDNILMNRPFYGYQNENLPMNILDILAQCGKEESFGFYVSEDAFAEYFDQLTVNHFKVGQIASMVEVLKEDSCKKFTRSFFLVAKNQNKLVLETFLNFYENLLKDSYFANPWFSSFISILILNKQSDHGRLKKLTEKLADLNKKSLQELFSFFKLKLGAEWGNAIRENIKHFHNTNCPEHFEKAINFYVDVFDNKEDGSYSDQQFEFWYKFILTLLDEQLFDEFKIAVTKLAEKNDHGNNLLRDIFMKKDDKDMTLLQKVLCLSPTEKDTITDFIFRHYKRIFGSDASEIRDLFLEIEFFIKLLLAENDIIREISSIVQFLRNLENETNSWLELMISYSNFFETNLIDSFLKAGVLSKLSFKDKHPELPKLMKEILQKCKNSHYFSEVIYEIFSNEYLTKDQLAELSDALFFKNKMLETQINQIISYKHPTDESTIIIAASKCKHEGRIEILMKFLESCSDTEFFKSCFLAITDNSVLHCLFENKHQENYFPILFDKIESYHTNDLIKVDQIRDFIYLKNIEKSEKSNFRCKNIFYKTLTQNKDKGISEEKYKMLEKLFKSLSRDEQKQLIFAADKSFDSLLALAMKQPYEISKTVLNLTLETLFENEKLFHKVLKKLKRFSVHGGKVLMNAEVFSSAFHHYKLKGNRSVIDGLHELFYYSASNYFHNLSIGNFQFFRHDRVIHRLISKIKNDKYFEESDKIIMITFIFMLNCDDYVQLLESAKMIEVRNLDQSRNLKFLLSLIKSMKLNIEEMEVFFEKNNRFNESTFCILLSENLYRFLQEFLDFIESMCNNKTEFRNFLASKLSQLKYSDGDNIFHEILLNSQKGSDSTLYFDIYEILKTKLGDSNLLNALNRQTNRRCETPMMLALKYIHIEKCLKFFSENIVVTSMKDLLKVNDSLNDISHLIFKNLFYTNKTFHNDFESIIKPLIYYFEDSEINEMFVNLCTKKYPGNQNIMHVLFQLEFDLKKSFDEYLSLLFDEMKNRFGIDRLTDLMLEENENNQTPLEVIRLNEPRKQYLKLIEKHFDSKTIRILLSKNEGTCNSILYKVLKIESTDDKIFTFQFYKKYFLKEHFENMLRKVFEASNDNGNRLINVGKKWLNEDPGIQLNSYFGIISDNIYDIEFIKTILCQVNNDGLPILAIDNSEYLFDYVQVVKLAEFYFSRDVIKSIFKIEDSTNLQKMFIDAKDYERYEMIELLKKYHPDEWTMILCNNQVQSIPKDKKLPSANLYKKMKIIDLESKEYGYAFYELHRILVKKLSNFEKSIEQENNYQGYAIVIHEFSYEDHEDIIWRSLLSLQAVFYMPLENLTNARIKGLGIEWQYNEKNDKIKSLTCMNDNRTFSFDMIFNTCIAIKLDNDQIKVIVPIQNSENSLVNTTVASNNTTE